MFRFLATPLAAVCCLIFASPVTVIAQTTTHVSGSVVDSDGHPAAGVPVTLRGGNISRERTSDSQGHFSFFGLSVGSYAVTAKPQTGTER